MKIHVTGLRGIPDVSGGVETHCEYLFGQVGAVAPDAEVIVCGRRPYVTGARRQLAPGLWLVPLFAARNRYLEAISNTAVAIWNARRERADILHIHAIGPALLSPMAVLLGLPVVLTHHGDDFARAKWNGVARKALRLGERIGVRRAEQVIAVSASVADRLRRDYPDRADRIHYIPNGADHVVGTAVPAEAVLPRFGLTRGNYIVSVGRLVPEKGFLDLIAAHERARSGRKLVIVGGHSNSDHDRALRDAAGPDVVFTGTLPRAEVATLLAACGRFVLASHHEGLPIAALEAAALDAPVLLSDIQANRDLGLPEKHYFPVGDVDALATRLAEASGGEDLRAPALKEDFAWTDIAARTMAVCRKIHLGDR